MAGICGWLGEGRREDAEARLSAMATALRDPEDAGPELAIEACGAVGAVAAFGQDGSVHSHGAVTVAWSGVVDRKRSGIGGRAIGEALLQRYRESGAGCLSSIRGDVAIAFLDDERQELVLAIDRVGARTLVYRPTTTGVAFASTVTALASDPNASPEIDLQSIFDFVYFHMIASPRSVYRGWRKLLPGEALLVKDKDIRRQRYWMPRYPDNGASSEAELANEYRHASRAAVQSCLDTADGKVGAFLSGGTDSSTVAGLLGELTGEPARTYSIGFDVPGYDESQYAQIAVRHFGCEHHEYTVTPDDVVAAAPRLARHFDEPFGNASAVASLFCAELAKRDGIGTLFGGDGGDEIFAGNERYAKQQLFERYYRIPAAIRRSLIEPIVGSIPGNGFPIGKAKSYIKQALIPLPDRLETYNFLSRMQPGDVFAPEFLASIERDEPLALLRDRFHETPSPSVLHRLLYLDLKFTLADNDLRKVSGTCAMAGVDVRYPFLDPDLIDFANRVPPGLKLKGQRLRYFFKRASEGFLPPEILAKQKHGFGVPCGRWMRDHPPLRELAYDSLASLRTRGYLSPAFIDNLRSLHGGEHVDYYGVMVWVLTMLELWHQHHAR